MRRVLIVLSLSGGLVACQGNGPLMAPGSDCLACHSPGGGAHVYTVAGTVYPSPGAVSTAGVEGATVVVTDANGQRLDLPTNAAGNFYTETEVAFPVMTEVQLGAAVRHMEPSLTNGSCGSCHQVNGIGGAAGRVYIRVTDTPISPDAGVLAR